MEKTIRLYAGDTAFTKAEAYHVARLLITDPEAVSDKDRRRLMLFFAPAVKKTPKTAEEYVATFVAPRTDVRYYLQYMQSHGGFMFATDGFTAAWCPTERDPGYYHPRTRDPVELSADYPAVWNIVGPKAKQRPLDLSEWEILEHQGIAKPDIVTISPAGNQYRRDFVLRALAGCDSVVYQEPFTGEGDAPGNANLRGSAILKNGDQAQFLIRPLQPENRR